jgi:hypothetical protein
MGLSLRVRHGIGLTQSIPPRYTAYRTKSILSKPSFSAVRLGARAANNLSTIALRDAPGVTSRMLYSIRMLYNTQTRLLLAERPKYHPSSSNAVRAAKFAPCTPPTADTIRRRVPAAQSSLHRSRMGKYARILIFPPLVDASPASSRPSAAAAPTAGPNCSTAYSSRAGCSGRRDRSRG